MPAPTAHVKCPLPYLAVAGVSLIVNLVDLVRYLAGGG